MVPSLEGMKKYSESSTKDILLGKKEVGDMTFANLSELKDKLKINHIDTSSIEDFKDPIKLSKADFDKFKAGLLGTDTQKLEKLKDLVSSKIEIKNDASSGASDLKAAIATGGIASVAALAKTGFKEKMEEAKDAEGFEKLEKFSDIWEWGKEMFKKFTSTIAIKMPFLAKIFGWKNEYPELADAAGKAQKKAGEVVDAGKEAVKKAEEKKDELVIKLDNSPEKWQARKDELMKKFADRWGVDLNSKENKDKFEKCWVKYQKDIGKYTKEEISDKNKSGQSLYLLDIPVGYTAETFKFMISLATCGIVPAKALLIEAKEGGKVVFKYGIESGKTIVGLTGNGMEDLFGEMSIEELNKTFDSLDKEERVFLGDVISRKLGTMTMLMGMAAGEIVDLIYLTPLTWNERTTIKSGGLALDQAFGKYDEISKGIEGLISKTGTHDGLGATRLREHLIEVHTQSKITNIYMNSGEDTSKFLSEVKALATEKNIKTGLIEDVIRKIPDASKKLSEHNKEISKLVSSQTSQLSTDASRIAMKAQRFVKGIFANPNIFVDDVIERTMPFQKGMGEIVMNRGSSLEVLSRLRNSIKISKIPGSVNSSACSIHAENMEEVTNVIKYGSLEVKNLIAGMFRGLPIFIIGYNSLKLGGDSSVDKVKSFAQGMTTLIPGVGPIMLFRQGTEFKNGELPSKGDLILGGSLLTIDTVAFLGLIARGASRKEYFEFFARPAYMLGEVASGAVKAGVGAYEISALAIKACGNASSRAELFSLARVWGAWGIVLAALAAGGFHYYKKGKEFNPDQLMATLKTKGFIDNNGAIVPDKIKAGFSTLSASDQEFLSNIIVDSRLNGPVEMANLLSKNKDDKLKNREFEIEKKGAFINVRLNSIATIKDKEAIKNEFDSLGIKVSFTYTYKAMQDFAKEFKEKGVLKQEYVACMQKLGIEQKDSEKYYS